jgi:hypothetical protein
VVFFEKRSFFFFETESTFGISIAFLPIPTPTPPPHPGSASTSHIGGMSYRESMSVFEISGLQRKKKKKGAAKPTRLLSPTPNLSMS